MSYYLYFGHDKRLYDLAHLEASNFAVSTDWDKCIGWNYDTKTAEYISEGKCNRFSCFVMEISDETKKHLIEEDEYPEEYFCKTKEELHELREKDVFV